jgi:hypothetical protein
LSKDCYILITGNADQVREWFEEQIEDAVGFFVMLQENTDDGFTIYLHSDNEDDLTEEQLQQCKELGLDPWNDAESWEAIQRILGVPVH